MANAIPKEERTIIATKKIRVFPKDESRFIQALHTYRLAYNLTVEAINAKEKLGSDLRRSIMEKIKATYTNDENPEHYVYDVNLIYEAYRKCEGAYRAQLKKFKAKGTPFTMRFMSWKYSPRYFMVFRLAKCGFPYPRQLGEIFLTESLPEESFDKSAVVKYENGQWYMYVQQHVSIARLLDGETSRICALDPGVRTFQTLYSESQAVKYGEGFSKEVFLPVVLSISKWISKRDLFIAKFKDRQETQYYSDMMKYFKRKLNKLKARRNNLINDLHKQVAYDIVMNNDVILLPSFNTSNMVSKGENGRRKLRKKTIRAMLNLSHYKFKVYLNYLAMKYGKTVIEVNEAYTSKTFAGKIFTIGSKEKFKTTLGKIIDRDINGARNILIRFLTKACKVNTLHT